MTDKVSLIIPTFCRSEYLERQFLFFKMHGLDCPIFIVDGSPYQYADKNKGVIEKFENSLKITYYTKPSTEVVTRIFEKLKDIDTPYVITNNDDDFIIPSQIKRGVEFLETKPDYSLFQGRALIIDTKDNNPMGNIIRVHKYNQNSLEDESSLKRVITHQALFNSTYHSIQRTAVAIDASEKPLSHNLDTLFWELFQSSYSVAKGKVKCDNGLYLVRQGDQKRDYDYRFHMDRINWVTEPYWCTQCSYYIELLSKEIVKSESADFESVRKRVCTSFWLYLIPQLSQGYNKYFESEGIQPLSDINSTSKGLHKFEKRIKSFMKNAYSAINHHVGQSRIQQYNVDYPIKNQMKMQFFEIDKYFRD